MQFLIEELNSQSALFKIDGYTIKKPSKLKKILSIKTDHNIIMGHNKIQDSEIIIYFESRLYSNLKNKFSRTTIKYTVL